MYQQPPYLMPQPNIQQPVYPQNPYFNQQNIMTSPPTYLPAYQPYNLPQSQNYVPSPYGLGDFQGINNLVYNQFRNNVP